MNTTVKHWAPPKVDGAFISQASHPHIFAAHPHLRDHTDAHGMVLVSSAVANGATRGRTVGTADDGLAFAESYFAAKRGTALQVAAPIAPAAPAADAFRNFSPAALDRMRGGPPNTEIEESALDAHFAARRAARERRPGRRH